MPKSNKIWVAIYTAALLLLALAGTMHAGPTAQAAAVPAATPAPTPTPPLNMVTIGNCRTANEINAWIADEQAKGLVMDARPFAINQSTGRLSFNGSTGRVTVAHMNPFAYDYQITVAQQELMTTALSDFVKLLLPPNLGTFADLQSGDVGLVRTDVVRPGKLEQIASRIEGMKPPQCKSSDDPTNTKTAACIAMGEMYETFSRLQRSSLLGATGGGATEAAELDLVNSPTMVGAYRTYIQKVAALREKDTDAFTTCTRAQDLNGDLSRYDFTDYFNKIDRAQKGISNLRALATDLQQLATDFDNDTDLKDATFTPAGGNGDKGQKIRCKGYNCAGQFSAYAGAAIAIIDDYQSRLTALKDNAVRMQKMFQLTEQMKSKQGLFARTFNVIKKFELSQATVSVKLIEIPDQAAQSSQAQSGNFGEGGRSSGNKADSGDRDPSPALVGGEGNEGRARAGSGGGRGRPNENDNRDGDRRGSASLSRANNAPADGGGNNSGGNGAGGGNNGGGNNSGGGNNGGTGAGNDAASTAQLNEVIQIGRPRFALSGGLVYSPLPRRTFASVKGFTRDAQGNPTGNGSADVVGFGENSSRRILPMLMLNTRLTNFEAVDLYFTWGVSAKRDDNFDIEYLFGPSVGLLNNRAFFTFGAYGGQTQNLVPDIAVGDALPDTIGDAKLYTKRLTWKPGFSFSYNFSRVKKVEAPSGGESGGSGGSTPPAGLKNEIRIGSIPFNLALGVAYTSLEQHTYDEVVGFARDRQGNLTNGRTLTRIVGQTSSSSYRLTPLVLLHSRLTNFGSHDFYFSTGVTGKKTDNSFDIEYLVGGSVNLYQRKLFLTFGGFAGKQQILGGDFFEGAALDKQQNVTTQNRYVWKPAISFSYDFTKLVKRTQ